MPNLITGSNWGSCQPRELFTLPVVKRVPDDKQLLLQQLHRESRGAQLLILWLDCDLEGENIAFEVADACLQVRINESINQMNEHLTHCDSPVKSSTPSTSSHVLCTHPTRYHACDAYFTSSRRTISQSGCSLSSSIELSYPFISMT